MLLIEGLADTIVCAVVGEPVLENESRLEGMEGLEKNIRQSHNPRIDDCLVQNSVALVEFLAVVEGHENNNFHVV